MHTEVQGSYNVIWSIFIWEHPLQAQNIWESTQNISHQKIENYIRLMNLSPKMDMFIPI